LDHTEVKRVVKGAKTALLFIHGIAGTPNHFNAFISLVPEQISVYNILLDGHGKGVKDFSRTSMKKWEDQVQGAIDELSSTHEKIYIIAHSMGTLFVIDQAIKNKKIAELFLLAVPIKLLLKPKMFATSLKIYFDKISPDDKLAAAAKSCYGIEQDKNFFKYIGWVPRYLELFSKIRQTRKILPFLKTPCTAYQSSGDEMVSLSSINRLKQNSHISVVKLKKSGHYYYDTKDLEFLLNSFKKLIDNI